MFGASQELRCSPGRTIQLCSDLGERPAPGAVVVADGECGGDCFSLSLGQGRRGAGRVLLVVLPDAVDVNLGTPFEPVDDVDAVVTNRE